MKVALLQITSSDDPDANAGMVAGMAREAARDGARLIATPEVTNCVSADRDRRRAVLRDEDADATLASLREVARDTGATVSVGSLALTGGQGGRLVNRSVLIDGDGEIVARYDKIHMFDVAISAAETYRESADFAPGDRAVTARTGGVTYGLAVCYDLRFPQLHLALAQAGAEVILQPSAFSPETGTAHWEPLLRARAIETGCWVLAAAQTGTHPAAAGRARRTHGHSLIVDPWGRVVADGGTAPGIVAAEIDLALVAQSRARVPSLGQGRDFARPA